MYQSEWTKRDVLHLFPHWNWLPGQTVDMWCYYNNADEVELYVNGRSQGIRRKSRPGPEGERYTLPLRMSTEATEFHVAWRVKYEPGEVKVVARRGGRVVGEKTIHTAGAPDHIRLTMDYDGRIYNSDATQNLVYVVAEVVDKDGNLCPNAENDIFFDVMGADIAGVDNGSQFSLERFKANHRKTFFGKCIVVLAPHDGHTVSLGAQAVDLGQARIDL